MARVLHIEDDPNNRRLVQKLLGAAGHQVIEAEGGGKHIAPAIRFAGEQWKPGRVPAKGEDNS